MAVKINTKKARKLLYSGLVLVLIFWTLFAINSYWQTKITSLGSTNSAILIDIKNSLAKLPKPSTIIPAQTSGNANPLISNYLSSQKTLSELQLEQSNIVLHGHKVFSISALNSKSQNLINDINATLDDSTNIIDATQKFIEYNPKIDLAPLLNGDESGSTERLDRTKRGLLEVINSVRASEYSQSQQIESQISPLLVKVDRVNQQNTQDWFNDVLDAQQSIIVIIDQEYNSNINRSSIKLSELANSYLE